MSWLTTPDHLVRHVARINRALTIEETCNLIADTFSLPIPDPVSEAWAHQALRDRTEEERERFYKILLDQPMGSYDVDHHYRVNDMAIRRWQHSQHRAHGESRWVA